MVLLCYIETNQKSKSLVRDSVFIVFQKIAR